MRLSSNIVGDDKTEFPHKLVLTNRQVENLCKAFTNKSSTDTKLSKTQLSKIVQSRGFLGSRLGPLLKLGSGCSSALKTTTLIISNDKMKDLIEIVKSLEVSRLLLKVFNKTIQNEIKKQKGGFLSLLLGTLVQAY